MYLALLDQTIVAAALPAIAADIGGVDSITWVVLAYLLTATVAAPTYGKLGDIFSKRRMLIMALAVAVCGSVICMCSNSIAALIGGRLVQGLGGGGLMALSHSLLADVVPPRERARFQGVFSSVGMLASTTGPVLGGVMAQAFGWQSIFAVTIPLACLAMVLALRLPASMNRATGARFDFLGLALLVAVAAPLLVALHNLQSLSGFGLSLALFVVSAFSLVGLYVHERRVAVPFIALDLVLDANVWRCCVIAACHGAGLVSILTFLPLYMGLVFGATGIEIGLALLPVTIGIAFGSTLTGAAISRTGYTARFSCVGLSLASGLMVILAVFPHTTASWLLSAHLAAIAFGLGTAMGAVIITSQLAAGIERVGAVAGLVQLFRSIGAALGTALAGLALFGYVNVSGEMPLETLNVFISQTGDNLDAAIALDRSQADVISSGFRVLFITIAIFPAVGALLAGSLPMKRLT